MRFPVFAVGIPVVALALSSCGGGGSSSPSAPSQSGTATVNILGQRGAQSFSPNPATAGQNQTLNWRNSDFDTHRIVANDGSFDTGDIAVGATSTTVRMVTDGANYHCTIHPTMIGSINAGVGAPPPCTGAYC